MDPRRAARGNPVGDPGDGDENGRGSEEDTGVGRIHAVEHRGEDAGAGGGHRGAESDSHEDERDPSTVTRVTTSFPPAPSAIRIPISLVLRLTEYETAP